MTLLARAREAGLALAPDPIGRPPARHGRRQAREGRGRGAGHGRAAHAGAGRAPAAEEGRPAVVRRPRDPRPALCCTLAALAGRLGADELRVLVLIAARTR